MVFRDLGRLAERGGDFLVLPAGSASQFVGPSAESMRMMPYLHSVAFEHIRRCGRPPQPARIVAVLVAAHGRAADGARPDRGDERADGQSLGGDSVGHGADRVVAGVGIGVRMEREQIDAFELLAVDFALAVSSSIRSRLIGGWSVPASLPTSPGHMALCSLG